MTSPDPRSPASTWNYFTFVDCETSRLSFLHARSSSVSLTPLLFRANYFSALFSFLPSFTNLTHLNIQYIVHSSSNLLEILPTTRKYLRRILERIFPRLRLTVYSDHKSSLDLLQGSKLACFNRVHDRICLPFLV